MSKRGHTEEQILRALPVFIYARTLARGLAQFQEFTDSKRFSFSL